MPNISIIVPVYNVEKYLDICLDSLINQTYTDFEIICINDGSTDRSLSILSNYAELDGRIKVFSQTNKGLSVARNRGLELAKGKYIVFVDSDDYLSSRALEKMFSNIEANNSDFMFSLTMQVFLSDFSLIELPPEKLFKEYVKTPTFSEKDLPANFLSRLMPSAWAKMYRFDFIKDFKFPAGLIFEDMPFFFQCYLNAKKISYDFSPLYYYRQSQNTIIAKKDERFLDIFKISELVTEIFIENKKYEKYKTYLLLYIMEAILMRTLQTTGPLKRQMFNKIQEKFGKTNFSDFDTYILANSPVYNAYLQFLNKNYNYFREFESKVKNVK